MSSPIKIPALDNSFGAGFIGLVLAAILYGALTVQTYTYFRKFQDDQLRLKCLVVLLWVLNTFHLALLSNTLYYYLVSNYANPLALIASIWQIRIHVLVNGLIPWLVQVFYAHRVFLFSNRNYFVTCTIVSLACVQLGVSTFICIESFSYGKMTAQASTKWISATVTGLGSTLACDLVISGSLCYLLRNSRTGFKRADSVINALLVYTLVTGLLTSIFAGVNLILYATMPDTLIELAPNFFLAKLYTNSLLTTLNHRERLRTRWSQAPTAQSVHLSAMKAISSVPGNDSKSQNQMNDIAFQVTNDTEDQADISGASDSENTA
ncbi:hypothetical protein BD410DRAFT_98536 [Rickenella mellea]|uniref:DUF6534 domain-containing protein n=1 Tax=Rickenella mellea TaxID=50990 RepID=A0A4Y7QCS7_9AGAM|nr:hypothetical protein BD410DRAFT_98536 [Rickenella mellea]